MSSWKAKGGGDQRDRSPHREVKSFSSKGWSSGKAKEDKGEQKGFSSGQLRGQREWETTKVTRRQADLIREGDLQCSEGGAQVVHGENTFGRDSDRYWPREHSARGREEQQADDAHADEFLHGRSVRYHAGPYEQQKGRGGGNLHHGDGSAYASGGAKGKGKKTGRGQSAAPRLKNKEQREKEAQEAVYDSIIEQEDEYEYQEWKVGKGWEKAAQDESGDKGNDGAWEEKFADKEVRAGNIVLVPTALSRKQEVPKPSIGLDFAQGSAGKERPATRLRSNDEEEEWEPEEEYKPARGAMQRNKSSSRTPQYWRLRQPENQAEAQPSSSSSGSYVPGSITAPAAASEQRRGAKPWDTEVLTEAQYKTIKARAAPYGNYRERMGKERWQVKATADPAEERTVRPSRNPLGYGAGSGTPAAAKSSEYI